jgi:hypothetical protein
MNFTRTPNPILDQLPEMDKSELKLTMLLVRLTFGYSENGRHREEIKLTFDDMCQALNVARGTINRAVQLVEDRGFFRRGRRSTWVLDKKFSLNSAPNKLDDSAETRLKPDTEIVQKLDQNSLETELNQLDDSTEIRLLQSNKEKEKKVESESPFPFRPSPKTDLPEHRGPADKRVDAIMSVCGYDPTIDRHLRNAESAAAQLRSYSAGAIVDRYRLVDTPPETWYWYRDDWRGRKGQRPTPDGILETISLARLPENAVPASANGRASPGAHPAPAVPVLVEIEEGSGLY